MNNKITTPHLTLSAFRECDFDAMMAIFKSDAVKATYMVPDLPTRDTEMKLFTRIRELSERDDRYVFGIFLEDKLIGLLNDTEISGKTIEVGYAFHPDYWGKGIMQEALTHVLAFGFERLGLNRIEARYVEENERSRHVMERVGMTFEGILRDGMLVKGKYVNVGICSILRSEWERMQKNIVEKFE